MKIVRVLFTDWNGEERRVDVTSDMCELMQTCEHEETMFTIAIRYIKRRYIECYSINAVELVAR